MHNYFCWTIWTPLQEDFFRSNFLEANIWLEPNSDISRENAGWKDRNAPTELISTHFDIVLQRLLKAQE